MAVNDSYVNSADGLANGGDLIIDGTGAGTGAVEVFELGGGGAADIYKETDPNDDGTYEVSVLIDSFSGSFHSQKNQLVVTDSNNHRLRINNTSGGPADFFATGMEVDD